MNYYLYFTISSMLILLLIGTIYFLKEKVNNIENKFYSAIIICTLVGCIFEISMLFTSRIMDVFPFINTFVAKGYLVITEFWIFLLCVYTMIITFADLNIPEKSQIAKCKRMLLIFIIGAFITCILPIYYYFKPNSQAYLYTYGPSTKVVFIIGITYISIAMYYLLKNKKHISSKKNIPIFIYIILSLVVSFLQQAAPDLTMISFVEVFITILMYFTIENPDVKLINQLNLAKENAVRANEAKTEFLSSMSHEIRTPLNAIVGFSNSILEDNTLEEAKTEAKDIIMASNNLLEIVNGILDISKIEAGKMEIVETEYNLLETLNNITKLIIPRIGEKPIELKTNFSKDIPTVLYGDMSKVREIVTNLLTNAVKYTEKGIIDLSVQCINTKNKSKLVISVEDTGRGIKSDKIDKLFTKFQRLEEDKNTTLEGTGLGLAITKSLVEMLGGKIVVQSKYGSGSKFTVYLEQKIIKMIEEKQFIEEIKDDEKHDYSNKKILIVDDNMLNIKVAARLLKNYQITPDSVLSGQECLDKVKETSYDLIFMDDMMPNMSGPETLQILKKDKNFKTPVVILTANAISGMKEKYLKNGFNDYLAKPIDKLELDRILKEYLKDNKNN